MKQIYSDMIQFRGSHYEFGVKQGSMLKDSLILKNWAKQWHVKNPRITLDEKEAKPVITAVAPRNREEIDGLQDALEWKVDEVLRYFGGDHVDYRRSG